MVLLYYNKVYNVGNRSSKKNPSDKSPPATSIRAINKEWKKTDIQFTINRRKTYFSITSLFDIIKDKDQLTGAEKVFYHDQLNERKCRLSEEIDNEWLIEHLAILEQQESSLSDEQSVEEETDDDIEDTGQELNISTTRSGKTTLLLSATPAATSV